MSATLGKLMCIYNPLLGRGIHLLTALSSCQPRQVSCLPDSGLKFYPPRLYNGIVHATNMKARQKERKKEVNNIVSLLKEMLLSEHMLATHEVAYLLAFNSRVPNMLSWLHTIYYIYLFTF